VYYVLLLHFVLLVNKNNNSGNHHVALALYADEVGLNDFSIATAGHGPVRSAWFVTPEVVVTSNSYRPESSLQKTNNNLGRSSSSSSSSIGTTWEGSTTTAMDPNWNPTVTNSDGCYVAGRNASTGILLWRRNVCSSSSSSSSRIPYRSAPRHSTTVVIPKTVVDSTSKTTSTITSDSAIITLDNAGILQRWDATSGSLLWNVPLGMFSPTPLQMSTTTTERLYSWDENDAVIAVTYRTRVGNRDYHNTIKQNKNHGVQIQEAEEGLSIHSIHTGQPMYYNDDTGLQPLVIYAQDLLLSNVDIANPNRHQYSSSTSNINDATTTTTHSARILNVRAITDRKLYIIAGYVLPSQAMITSTAYIGIFHVDIIAHRQQYEITKSIPLQQQKTTFTASSRGGGKHNNNHNSPTYVDASLFRFAILPGSSISAQPPHYAITVIVPPPDSSTEEQTNYYQQDILSIPITSDTSSATTTAKRSVHSLHWDATRKSTITDIMVQESDNIIMLSIIMSTESRKKNMVKMVRLLSDGQMNFVEQSSTLPDKEEAKGLVTTTAGATSTAQCGVSHTILAQIHPPDVRHPNAHYYSIQIINKVEHDEESTKEEIFFNDIPVHILDPATHGPITSIHAISCVPPTTSAGHGFSSTTTITTTPTLRALASTSGGTTIMLQLSERKSSKTFPNSTTTLWISEEALAWIQSVTFVDIHSPISSHGHKSTAQSTNKTVLVTTIDDEELPPSVTDRWLQQWDKFKSLLPGVSSSSSSSTKAATTLHQDEMVERRNINFGFAKRAVVLTSNPPRLFGLDMQKRGKVAWSMMLTDDSSSTLFSRHSLIHSGRHGQHHANEILILSQYQETKYAEDQTPALLVEWKCLDGVDGTELLSGTLELDGSKKVVHISPIRIYTGVHTSGLATLKCRQQSLVLFDDGSVEMIPPSKVGSESLRAYLRDHSSFVHSIDWRRGELRTRQLDISSSDNATVTSSLVGDIFFPPDQEKIVSVTYPSPEEVVQSPVTILGDDALLLKYLNPHLAVIITEVTPEYWKELEDIKNSNIKSQLMSSLLSGGDLSHHDSSREKTKKKPLGVTPTKAGEQDATTSAEIPSSSSLSSQQCPSLFINLVDTVSGKLLHRASYSHFSGYADSLSNSLRGRNIPVVISENWVVCAFWNYRTKRTDVSVLTLHDGMIDKHGITAFKRPQQETTFSSFESPKPIVLHRTFALSNEVTAVGVTQTARGISMKHFIFALGSGQVLSVDRRFLDPRRPSGEPKPAEKAEGLFRYHPIIPLIPQHVISYNLPIEGVSLIKSVAAQVESQSMVFACGGPDVFFVRLAPSKGFDLLPENFNKGLLLVVVISLIGIVLVMQRMSNIETLKATWF